MLQSNTVSIHVASFFIFHVCFRSNSCCCIARAETLADHENWVVSLASLPPGVVPECPQGGLVTGCMDKLVRVYDHLGKLRGVLRGHDGGVISFSWTAGGQVGIS